MRKLTLLTALVAVVAALAGGPAPRAQTAVAYSQAQIEQMVAPIALYPDALVSQVLMAATYPYEVSEADGWLRANPGLSGYELDEALATAAWDPSVISLCKFPTLLERMALNMQWTTDLGYAFLGQQSQVLGAVQRLRREAYRTGYLRSSPQQVVVVEPAFIEIRPYRPGVVYAPVYNPAVVYGAAWRYPDYYYRSAWSPSPGTSLVNGFAWGVGFVVAQALFGGLDWGRHEVTVNKTVIVNNRIFHGTDYYRNRDRYRNGRHAWIRAATPVRDRDGYRGAPYGGRSHGSVRGIDQRPAVVRTGPSGAVRGKAPAQAPRQTRPAQNRQWRRDEPARQNTPKVTPAPNRPVQGRTPVEQRRTYERPRQEAPRVAPGQNRPVQARPVQREQTNQNRGQVRENSRGQNRPVQARPVQREQTNRDRGQVRENNRGQARPARSEDAGKKVKPEDKNKEKEHKRN